MLALVPVSVYYSSHMDYPAPISAASATDAGQIRGHNEDFLLNWEPSTPEEAEENGWLYIVADGVGGADAGEIASKFAAEQVQSHYLADNENQEWHGRVIPNCRQHLDHTLMRLAPIIPVGQYGKQGANLANLEQNRFARFDGCILDLGPVQHV